MIYFYLRVIWVHLCSMAVYLGPNMHGSRPLRLCSRPCALACCLYTLRLCALRLSPATLRLCALVCQDPGSSAKRKGAEAPPFSVLLSQWILLGSIPCTICRLYTGRAVQLPCLQGIAHLKMIYSPRELTRATLKISKVSVITILLQLV